MSLLRTLCFLLVDGASQATLFFDEARNTRGLTGGARETPATRGGVGGGSGFVLFDALIPLLNAGAFRQLDSCALQPRVRQRASSGGRDSKVVEQAAEEAAQTDSARDRGPREQKHWELVSEWAQQGLLCCAQLRNPGINDYIASHTTFLRDLVAGLQLAWASVPHTFPHLGEGGIGTSSYSTPVGVRSLRRRPSGADSLEQYNSEAQHPFELPPAHSAPMVMALLERLELIDAVCLTSYNSMAQTLAQIFLEDFLQPHMLSLMMSMEEVLLPNHISLLFCYSCLLHPLVCFAWFSLSTE